MVGRDLVGRCSLRPAGQWADVAASAPSPSPAVLICEVWLDGGGVNTYSQGCYGDEMSVTDGCWLPQFPQ